MLIVYFEVRTTLMGQYLNHGSRFSLPVRMVGAYTTLERGRARRLEYVAVC